MGRGEKGEAGIVPTVLIRIVRTYGRTGEGVWDPCFLSKFACVSLLQKFFSLFPKLLPNLFRSFSIPKMVYVQV